MRKRMTSLLLTLVMLLSLVPAMGVTANAEDGFVEVSTYEELKNAVDKGAAKVKLMTNIDTTNENGGAGLTSTTNLTFKGGGHVLDLNGHTLKLVTSVKDTHLIAVESQDMTIQDSSSSGSGRIEMEFGENLTNIQYPIYISSMGSLTIDGGTFSSSFNFVNYIECYGSLTINGGTIVSNSKRQVNLIKCEGANLTINGGKLQIPDKNEHGMSYGYAVYTENRFGDDRQIVITDGEIDGKVAFTRNDSSATGTPKYNKLPVKITGGVFKQKVYAYYSQKPSGEITEFSPAVELAGGTFKDVYNENLASSNGLATKLTAGTFEKSANIVTHVSDTTMAGYRACLGNSVILRGNECRTACDWSSMQGFEVSPTGMYFIFREAVVIPNAWGMKSVTLDGNPIDYAKDWQGEWKRVENDRDHTLVFEWYPLSPDMENAGYTYDAKYLHYRTNSSEEPTPIPVDTSKNTRELKINKDALPGGYSYDFRLDLKKNGVDLLGSSTNQHIVMLVVYPAQVETKAITAVNLTVPELNAKDTAGTDVSLNSSAPAGSCTAETSWNIPGSGAVESTTYYATVTLTAKNGYAFGSGTAVNLTGDHVSQTAIVSEDGKTMTVRIGVAAKHVHNFGPWTEIPDTVYHERKCISPGCTYSEQETHKWVVDEGNSSVGTTFYKCSVCDAKDRVITNSKVVDQLFIGITHPMAGDEPDGAPSRWAKIYGPASCKDNASINSVEWYELDGETPVTRFEAGERYSVSITFEAKDGYQFVEAKNFNTRASDFTVVEKTRKSETEMTVVYTLSEDKPVQKLVEVKVKLPSLNDKVGESFTTGELVEAPAGITLDDGFYVNGDSVGNDSKVQPDKKYLYVATVKSENSLDSVSVVIVDEGDAVAAATSGGIIIASYHTPDTNKITSVALTITAPKYGEAPATSATGANDTLYTVGKPEWSPADAAFGEKAYTVSIPVTAVGSYSFADNCLYTINGYMAGVTKNADGSVTLSYAFPALTAPHTHNYTGQPWHYLDPGNHYQECEANDGSYNIKAHDFGTWTKVDADNHSRTCDDCNYTETANHNWQWVVKTAATPNAAGTKHEECVDCSAVKAGSETEIPMLTSIKVENLTVAKPVKDAAAAIATTGDSTYNVANTEWMAADGTPLAIGDKFQPGTVYTVKITLETAGAGVFSAKSTYNNIEGKTATLTSALTGDNYADSVILTYTFDKTAGGYHPGTGTGTGTTTYPITVKSAKNGDVTASHKTASKGTAVTLTVDPDKGYVLDTLTVLDGKDKELKLTEKNGKYTFTMPDSKVTVAATFKASAPTGKNPFIDVPAGSYYEDAVIWAVDKGITSGTSAVTFDPNGNCTRAQAVTFLWRAAGSPAPKTKVMPFTDVPSGSYYYDAVLWAMEQGITKGTSDTAFSPNASCTRAQIVTFLWRANGSPVVSGNSAFTDVASDAYYAAAVAWAEKNGVTGGIGNGLFGSGNNCTRAQIVTFLYRAMK